MKQRFLLLLSGLFLFAAVLVGCAMGGSERTATLGTPVSETLSDKAFRYRQQAAQLHDMAQRLELEAEWYVKQLGKDHEQTKRARAMALDLRSAAEEAEQQAHEYRSQVPHNVVY